MLPAAGKFSFVNLASDVDQSAVAIGPAFRELTDIFVSGRKLQLAPTIHQIVAPLSFILETDTIDVDPATFHPTVAQCTAIFGDDGRTIISGLTAVAPNQES